YEFGDGIYLNPESKTSSYGLPFVGFEAALLQGMFFDKRRAGVLKAREYIDYGKAERNEIVNDVLFNAINAYSELSFVNKQLTIYRYFIQLAQIRNNGISALAQIGEKPFIDTVEASIIYQSRVLELQALEIENRKKKASVNSFNWFQNGNTDLQFDFTPDSLDQLFEVYKTIMVRELNIDSINNPIIQQYKIKQNILKIDKRLKAEMIKPQLDVKYNFLTNDNGVFNPQLTSNNYRWGATLSFPLFLRTPRNEYKIAGLDVLNAKLETETKNNELNNKINFTVKALTVITEQINNAAKNVALSKRLLEAEKLKFDNGESSLFLLNMRENKWLETELKLAEYKLKFIETVLQLVHLKGNLNYKA
ncbi:MAG TPA: TolC family protein, partial [Bacteroidia bacterium]|nr:TolC family protein [Bacteroidia bacterium]